MKKPFLPVFVITLISLFLVWNFPYISLLFPSAVILSLLLSSLFFIFKAIKPGLFMVAVAVSLVMGIRFQEYRESYGEKILKNDFPEKEYVTVEGRVTGFPVTGKENTLVTVKVCSVERGKGIIEKRNFTLQISVNGDAGFLIPGESVSVDCVIDSRNFRENFAPNPLKKYLLSKNIHFRGHTKSALLIRPQGDGNLFFRWISWMRKRIRKTIEYRYLLDNGGLKPPGQLLEALLLGDRGRLGTDIKDALLDSGVFHLFAISGAHIGIITLFLIFILGKLRIKRKFLYLSVMVLLLIFLSLTGFKISAQRAVIMAIFILTGKMLFLKTDIINVISFSGLFILLMNPAQFLDPGFILTFAVTFGIVTGRYIFLKESAGPNNWFTELFVTNLSASVTSLPFSLLFFKRYSYSGFLSGFLLLPLTGIIMSASIPLIPFSLVSVKAASLLTLLIQPLAKLFFLVVDIFSRYIDLVIFRPSPPVVLPFIFISLFSLPGIFRLKGLVKKTSLFLSVVAVILVAVKPCRYSPSQLEAFFLDVGQGDSEVVVFPGGDAMLIDGGGMYFSDFQVGKKIVLPFLVQNRIDIRWVAISHFHPDHCRGVIEVLNIIDPREIWISSFPRENLYLEELLKKKKSSIRIRKLKAGYIGAGNGCEIRCVYPERVIRSFYEHNDNSQVLRIADKNISFLFTGDIEKKAEGILCKKPGDNIISDVVKIPHHGSKTSSTLNFLREVSPKIGVVSLAETNRFGFPHKEVLKRYKKLGVKLLRTSRRGGIKITTYKGMMFVRFSKYPGDEMY